MDRIQVCLYQCHHLVCPVWVALKIVVGVMISSAGSTLLVMSKSALVEIVRQCILDRIEMIRIVRKRVQMPPYRIGRLSLDRSYFWVPLPPVWDWTWPNQGGCLFVDFCQWLVIACWWVVLRRNYRSIMSAPVVSDCYSNVNSFQVAALATRSQCLLFVSFCFTVKIC